MIKVWMDSCFFVKLLLATFKKKDKLRILLNLNLDSTVSKVILLLYTETCITVLGNIYLCLGLGGTAPSPRGNATLSDGVIVPCGKATTLSKKQVYNLLYNEYIVYDEAQIKMKYLVRASISPS